MKKVSVKNHKGQFELPKGYDSFLKYWEVKKGYKANHCSSCGTSVDLVGGHVDYNDCVYLVPICQDCNNKHGEHIYVEEDDLLFYCKM